MKLLLAVIPAFLTVKLYQFIMSLALGANSFVGVLGANAIAGSAIGVAMLLTEPRLKKTYKSHYYKFQCLYVVALVACGMLFKSEAMMESYIKHSMYENLKDSERLQKSDVADIVLIKVDENKGNFTYNASIEFTDPDKAPIKLGALYSQISAYGYDWWRLGVNKRPES